VKDDLRASWREVLLLIATFAVTCLATHACVFLL
jgi:hypothetical protein